jgi:fido (protein-threonine AMPylation protein)
MIAGMQYPPGATPLDPNELGGLKHKHITTQAELDQLEQANIESGLRWLGRQRADVLSDSFVIMLHKRLFGEVWSWAGTFRKTGKNIVIDPVHIPMELRTLMGDVLGRPQNLHAFRSRGSPASPARKDSSVSERQRQACPHHGGHRAGPRLQGKAGRLGGRA